MKVCVRLLFIWILLTILFLRRLRKWYLTCRVTNWLCWLLDYLTTLLKLGKALWPDFYHYWFIPLQYLRLISCRLFQAFKRSIVKLNQKFSIRALFRSKIRNIYRTTHLDLTNINAGSNSGWPGYSAGVVRVRGADSWEINKNMGCQHGVKNDKNAMLALTDMVFTTMQNL